MLHHFTDPGVLPGKKSRHCYFINSTCPATVEGLRIWLVALTLRSENNKKFIVLTHSSPGIARLSGLQKKFRGCYEQIIGYNRYFLFLNM